MGIDEEAIVILFVGRLIYQPPIKQKLLGGSMKCDNAKKNLLMSIIVFIVMMLLLILLSNGSPSVLTSILITIILMASTIIVAIIWTKYYQYMKKVVDATYREPTSEFRDVIGHTGVACEISGLYECVEHEHRKVNMKKGRRFPPCKGVDKGHSTNWRLVKKSTQYQ